MSTASARRAHAAGLQVVQSLLVLVVLVILWQVLAEIVGPLGLSPPLSASRDAVSLLSSRDFWPNVTATFYPFLIAVVIETIVGIPIGVALGVSRFARDVFEPFVVGLYSIPKIVFYPIILLVFGIGMASEIVFALMHGILPIILFSISAVRLIRPIYLKTGRVLRLSPPQLFWSVIVPAVIPEIFSGLRIGYAATLLGVLFCEMFGSKNGLGYLLMAAIGSNRVGEIFALTLLLTSFALVMNFAMLAVDKWLHRRG